MDAQKREHDFARENTHLQVGSEAEVRSTLKVGGFSWVQTSCL